MATVEHPTALCDGCKAFDVRSLLLAAKASPVRSTRYRKQFEADTFRDLVKSWLFKEQEGEETAILQEVPNFFQLQPNLKALRRSGLGCSLCKAVWQEYSRQCRAFELAEEALSSGISNGPIYLGTLDWDKEHSQWPYVTAIQFDPDEPRRSRRHLACFEVCAEYGDVPENGELLARLQAKSSSDENCFILAKGWLDNCLQHHHVCRSLATDFFPTRILDISSDLTRIHLLDGPGRRGAYAALSYCWGDQRNVLLTQDSIWRLREGIPLHDLPSTLRDAVTVSRKLGIDYIWIDALCIFQDQQHPESLQDWVREASRMRDVYNGATITIEAAAANASDESFLAFPRVSTLPYCALPWVDDLNGTQADHYVRLRPMLDITDTQLLGARIYSRGWTLQERLLAPRTLSFGTQQVSFECAEGLFDEAGRIASLARASHEYLSKDLLRRLRGDNTRMSQIVRFLALALRMPKTFGFGNTEVVLFGNLNDTPADGQITSYYDFWGLLVSKFSERMLTDSHDRLPAISGLAREFQRTTRDTYVAGMWQSELVTSLAWTCRELYNASGAAMGRFDKEVGAYVSSKGYVGPNPERYASSVVTGNWPESVKNGEYIAPSWSWASVKGKIFYKFSPFGSRYDCKHVTEHAKVLKIKIEAYDGDTFGRLKGGHLVIKAPFVFVPTLEEPCPDDFVLKTWHNHTRTSNFWREPTESAISEYWQHHKTYEGQTYGIIQLFTTDFLDPWSRPEHNATIMSVLLVESVPGNQIYRRLCCLTVRLGTLEEIRTSMRLASSIIPEAEATISAKISEEFLGRHWKNAVIPLV